MHIILTANFSPWGAYSGGGQRSTHNLAVALSNLGYPVHVVFSKGWNEKIEIPEELPYSLHWALFPSSKSKRNAFFRAWSSRFTLLKVKEIVEFIQKNEKLVLHSNGEEGELFYKIKESRKNCAIVSTCRYPDLHEKLSIFTTGSLFQKLSVWYNHGKYLRQFKTIKTADVCAPPSQLSARLISEYTSIPCQGIHNGVPHEFLKYSWKKNTNGPIVFFGRLEHDKGVDVLLKAFSTVNSKVNRPLLIIGKGAEKKKYENLVSDLGLTERVTFLDWMNHDQLGAVIEDCSMVVLPSRKENFSLAILGAMAIGVPLIATNSGGTEEVLENNTNGIVVQIDDADGLAIAVERIAINSEIAQLMGDMAKSTIRKGFTWTHTAEKFIQLYKTL